MLQLSWFEKARNTNILKPNDLFYAMLLLVSAIKFKFDILSLENGTLLWNSYVTDDRNIPNNQTILYAKDTNLN